MEKKPNNELLLRLFKLNFFKLLGAALGLITAILFLTLGFWRTILIILLVSLGVAAGSWLDKGQQLMDLLDRFFPGQQLEDEDEFKF